MRSLQKRSEKVGVSVRRQKFVFRLTLFSRFKLRRLLINILGETPQRSQYGSVSPSMSLESGQTRPCLSSSRFTLFPLPASDVAASHPSTHTRPRRFISPCVCCLLRAGPACPPQALSLSCPSHYRLIVLRMIETIMFHQLLMP